MKRTYTCRSGALRKLGSCLALVMLMIWTEPASAIPPFSRNVQLGSILLSRMVKVAGHDLRDTHFVESTLVLNVNSPFAYFRIGNSAKEVSEHDFETASRRVDEFSALSMTGDALPLRTGKFWNLQFEYSLSPPRPYIPGVITSAMVNIFDVEEYACVTASDLSAAFPGKTAAPISQPWFEYRSFDIRRVGDERVSIVFQGPTHGPGCIRFIGIWQHKEF